MNKLRKLFFIPMLFAFALANIFVPLSANAGLSPMNSPASTTAQQSEQYVSLMDIQKPSIRNTLIRRFNDQGLGFLDVIQSLGYETPVDQTTFSHYEEDWIIETFTVNTNVNNPGAGNYVDIELSATNVDSSNKYYPRKFDDVLFPNQVTGKVYNINTGGPLPVLRVFPHQSTDNIGALAAGTEISIYSNGFPEGSDTPAGRFSKVSKITYGCKIMMEAFEVTNSEMTNRKWITVMSDGKDIGGYHLKGQFDAECRLRMYTDGAFLFDRPITQATLVADQHRNINGLVPEIRNKGLNGQYTGGFFSIPLFYQMQKKQKKYFAGSEFLCFLGIDLENEWNQLFTDMVAQNPIVLTKQGTSTVKDLEIDFSSIKIGTQTYHIKSMDIFSHPKLYNLPGYDLTGMGIIVPNKMEKDAKTRNNIPCIGMRYKEMDGYSRKLRIWNTGGGNNYANNQPHDKNKMQMVTEVGAEWMALNKFFLWERASS